MDRWEQKKLAAVKLCEEFRNKEGVEETAQRKQVLAADLYEKFNMRIDRHWSEKNLEAMTERDWRIFREDFDISYKGSRIPHPMRSWAESKLAPELLRAVDRAGYKTPSPIQMAAIPLGLQQRDVIGIAETGAGKTAAFILPMLTYISRLPPITEENVAEGPYAIVLVPTRELAQQIEAETVKFAHYLGLKVVSIVGRQSIEEQGFRFRQGCEIVIATPGRLIDCLERRYAVLNQCNYVVLDEADRMIDMGFERQVAGVLDAMLSRVDKTAIVFFNKRKVADIVAKALAKEGYRVTTLHGGISQEQRETNLEGFKTKKYNVLVATDVAGRGIDIPDVAHVINHDMPDKIEAYTHRIGRTGRAGRTGVATTFLTLRDTEVFYDLRQVLVQSNSHVPTELARHEASKFKPGSIPDRPRRQNDTTVYVH